MQVIVNHLNLTPNLAGFDSVAIDGQLSDPVGKAHFQLDDTGSAIPLVVGQEVIIVDETIPLRRILGTSVIPSPFTEDCSFDDSYNYTSAFNPNGSAATWALTMPAPYTSLALFPATATSAVLGTARQLYTTSGTPAVTTVNTTCNASTGWGELPAAGSTAAWPALGSQGAPSGKGFFLDATTLNGQTIDGLWTSNVNISQSSGTGTVTVDIVVRAYRYSSGVYTNIVTMTQTGQPLSTTPVAVNLPYTSGSKIAFATGDKLYLDYWVRISSNTSGTGQKIVQNNQSTDTVGKTGDPLAEVDPQGYYATNVLNNTISATGGSKALWLLAAWTALNATVTCTITTSDFGGLAWNVVDTNNYYELAIGDASSPVANTLQLYKTVAGIRTAIGSSASISFTRTTSHTVLVSSTNNGSSTNIVVLFDNTQKITYTDTSPLGIGQVGFRNDTQSGHSSSIYTAFSATSNDGPYITTTDLSVPSHNYINNNNFTLGNAGWPLGGTITGVITFPPSGTFGVNAFAKAQLANNPIGLQLAAQTVNGIYAIPGAVYCLSLNLLIQSPFVNGDAFFELIFLDASNTILASYKQTYTTTVSTSIYQRVLMIKTAPANTVNIEVLFGADTTTTSNSGTAFFTALQLEPVWFPATPSPNQTAGYVVSYPTPICDYLQPDCVTVIDGTSVRFNRIFAGFISSLKSSYNGPNRIWAVECTSFAGYLETDELINQVYTNTLDQTIIHNQITATAHLIAQTPASVSGNGPDFASANKVAVLAGKTIAATTYNDATPREMFNNLQNYSSYVFGVDNYNNVFYTPQFFNKAPYGFSTSPDNIATFAMYDYELERDGTQIRNSINVSGGTYQPSITETFVTGDGTHSQFIVGGKTAGFYLSYAAVTVPTITIGGVAQTVAIDTNIGFGSYNLLLQYNNLHIGFASAANAGQTIVCTYTYNALVYVQVQDIGSIQQYGARWYKINDNALGTLAAAQARGEAELAQYAQPRMVLKFKTQKMLAPGQTISVTNSYDGLSAAKFTVQSVSVTWLGNGINVYDITCGAYQPNLTDYMRNIHRAITRGSRNAAAILQTYVTANEGDSVTFSDSINIH